MSRPPTARVDFLGQEFDGHSLRVELADYPRWPDWQFCEPFPFFYVAPWMTPSESRWRPAPEKETAYASKVGTDMAMDLIKSLRSDPPTYRMVRKDLRGLWLSLCLKTAGGVTRRGTALSDVDRIMLVGMAVFQLTMLVQSTHFAPNPPRHVQVDPEQPFIKELRTHAPR